MDETAEAAVLMGQLLAMRPAHVAYMAMRERMIIALAPLAEEIANLSFRRAPNHLRGEILSAANVGILESVDKFDGRGNLWSFTAQRINWRIRDWAANRGAQFRRHASDVSLDQLMQPADDAGT